MDQYFHYDSFRISKQWFEIGEKKDCITSEDVAFRFVAYWISFNGLFARARNNHEDDTEQDQIENYISQEYDTRLTDIWGDIERIPEIEEFRTGPVFKGDRSPNRIRNYRNKSNPTRPYERFMDGENEKERLIGLLLMIKQVRNNLFHGQKTPSPERNYKLVNGSQKILGILLNALMPHN